MRIYLKILYIILSVCLLSSACAQKPGDDEKDIGISDTTQELIILTAAELSAFINSGEVNMAKLGASIDIDDSMLTLTSKRGAITIDGMGFTVTSSADCVVRMDDGAAIRLNNITLVGGADVIGCMGSASIGGSAVLLQGASNGIRCKHDLVLANGSDIRIESKEGIGIMSESLDIGDSSKLTVKGAMSAICVSKEDMTLNEGVYVDAATDSDYYAVKCEGTLTMKNGSAFIVRNMGDYHGAQLDYLNIEGNVTIKADGGSRGAGLFLFQLKDDYNVSGHCKPDMRKENGSGTIHFTED